MCKFTKMPGRSYLLIDSATPTTQVILMDDKTVLASEVYSGNSVDGVTVALGEILLKTHHMLDDFDGMIYCGGPGSSLGLRIALASINTWVIFGNRNFKLMTYDALDMGICLNQGARMICTYGVGDSLIVKAKDSGTIKISTIDELDFGDGILFLDTRPMRCEKYKKFPPANYDIATASFDILSLCEVANGELKNYGDGNYEKWSRNPIGDER
ncbi:MAG: hypothetical protein LBD34_01895 [Puniceicoccales bacterium]|jgi:hypothetical protein|nr:hypothetical protein [Puniceicoccales bacterium]